MRPNRVFLLALLGWPLDVFASGWSADIELLRPSLSPGGALAVETPEVEGQGSMRYGAVVQLQEDPLVYYENGLEQGAVVRFRTAAHLGVSRDLTDGLAGRIVVPVAWQWGEVLPSAETTRGPGLGDVAVGLRGELLDGEVLDLGLRGDLYLPTGRREAWMGEEYPRLWIGWLGSAEVGRVSWLNDVGLMARSPVETDRDFALGPELTLQSAVRAEISWGVDAQVGLLGRAGAGEVLSGGAENALEAVVGTGWTSRGGVRFDVAVGRGISMGYGTTDFRLVGGVTLTKPARPDRAVEPDIVEAADAELTDQMPLMPDFFVEEPEPEPEWKPDEVARIQEQEIVLRDPIHFELGTATILPVSLHVLDEVAALMNSNPAVLHVLIEGHASDEGSYAYNYELSNARARAIFEALVKAGVHPDRLSYRGMGEVVPGQEGREADRRVVFRIVRTLRPDEPPPTYTAVPLPWSGEERR